MSYKKTLLTVVTILTSHLSIAQIDRLSIKFIGADKRIEIERDKETVIPVEIEIEKSDKVTITGTLDISVEQHAPTTLGSGELSKITFRTPTKTVALKKGKQSHFFYLLISKDIGNFADKVVALTTKITVGGNSEVATYRITLVNAFDLTYTLGDYLANKEELKLNEVFSVQSSANVLTLSGYKNNAFAKRNVVLERNEILAIRELNGVWNLSYLKPVPISMITIPFKVRPAITVKGKEFRTTSTSGLTNIGFNFELGKYQIDRYFATGRKSTHRWSVGFAATPSVEELDSETTSGALATGEKSKQLFISSAITIAYSYNDISFVFSPAGWDIGTSSLGRKWVYEGKRWWGFGIAISPKIFSAVLNK